MMILKVVFIVLGMFLGSGISIRMFKDLTSKAVAPIQFWWHTFEMITLITFLSFLVVGN